MKLDLDELERKAKGASTEAPGVWRDGSLERQHVFCELPSGMGPERVLLRMNAHFPHEVTAAHIAAASPPVMLALIARIRELEAFGRRLMHDHVLHVDESEMHAMLDKGVVLP